MRTEVESVEDPVGLAEIAERLGVQRRTAVTWHSRGLLPKPAAVVSTNIPVWSWPVIEDWARETGRLKGGEEKTP